MSRLRWIGWAVLLLVLGVLLAWARGPLRASARAILDRVKLRERESARRLEDTKRKDAEAAARMAKSEVRGRKAKRRADVHAQKAQAIEKERRELAERLAEEIEDEERAARFRNRHGLRDPRNPVG